MKSVHLYPPSDQSRKPKALWVSAPKEISFEVIQVSRHVFDPEEDTLARIVGTCPLLFVIDDVVHSMYGKAIEMYARQFLNCLAITLVGGSEGRKSLDQVIEVCGEAIKCGLGRDGVIVAVGGGVALDVGGLAASLFRRGVKFVRVPTTLVGLVDVCVGIKHGVNFASKKNIIGTFYPPLAGINDPSFLKTLPRRQLACGVAEIVKMGVVCDPVLLDLLDRHGRELLNSKFETPSDIADRLVFRAAEAMIRELKPNLFEQDLQRLVDFGHTFSPTLEVASNYELAHGEAVAIDMLISVALGEYLGLTDQAVLDFLIHLYRLLGLPMGSDIVRLPILARALEDTRRHRGGNLNLVVPLSLGHGTFVQSVNLSDVEAALVMLNNRSLSMFSDCLDTNDRR